MNNLLRTRFAPSPSGFMHLGNARSALLSYLYAKQHNGSFILRIEDTDSSRIEQKFYDAIFFYCGWLSINPDEGPQEGGSFGPYCQSERHTMYQKYCSVLEEKKLIYRCFKTPEECEKDRAKQIACGLPPRHQRPVYADDYIYQEEMVKKNTPFVWRFKIDGSQKTIIHDKVRGEVTYDLAQFSDFPLTRQDGTFTFIFANFVDDVEMKISYIMRGEEHFSNSALQSALYDAFNCQKPEFYHLPLICDNTGKKLSKRDFGFSLHDLIDAGFLPEAVINYLIIIGGSFTPEIFGLEEAIKNKYFEKINGSGAIKYDIKKLEWINKQWMSLINTEKFIEHVLFFINNNNHNLYHNHKNIISDLLKNNGLVEELKKESVNIVDFINHLLVFDVNFDIKNKNNNVQDSILENNNNNNNLESNFVINKDIINFFLNNIIINNYQDIINLLLQENNTLKKSDIMQNIRFALTGNAHGISIALLFKHLGKDIIEKRLKNC